MTSSGKTRPTMLDVAELSGVSYQTVSRVINNHPYVSDEARRRVQEAIDTLGYRPSKAARNLAAKSTKTIAIVLYGSWFHGPVEIALNVEMAAKTSGYDVIISNVTETRQQVTEALHHVKDWDVDGIIMIVPAQGLSQDEVHAISGTLPIVQIDSQHTADYPTVTLDEATGTRQIVEHLLSLGHRRFCEISGPLDWFSAQVRHQTCADVLRAHGAELVQHIESNWSTPGGYQATRRLLNANLDFTAIVAANDNMALGALRALYQAGISVPGQVSVVGYDDIAEAAYFTPPMTTIRHNFIQLGAVGFEYLLQLIDDPRTPSERRVVTPTFVLRESTATVTAIR
ncbi:MAG: LacI family DNA-binding transcriptional regulator [Anaerolineae bacterium]